MAKKYAYFNVATPTECENFGDYHDALRFYLAQHKIYHTKSKDFT